MQENKEKPEEENVQLRQVVVEQAKQLLQKEKQLLQKEKELAKKDEELANKDEELAQMEKKMAELESLISKPSEPELQQINSAAVERELQMKPDNKWCANAKSSILEISRDALTVELADPPANLSQLPLPLMMVAIVNVGGTVRAEFPLQRGQRMMAAYFEVKVIWEMRIIFIGLTPRDFPYNKSVGCFAGSYSLDSSGDLNIDGKEKKIGPAFGNNQETVGCGVAWNGQLFFTLNGNLLGGKLSLPKVNLDVELYPAVTLGGHGTKLEANFGDNPAKPFMFNVETVKCLDQPD